MRGNTSVATHVAEIFTRVPIVAGLVGTAIAISMCVLSFDTLWQGRAQALANARRSSANLVATISSDIARNIESSDLSLRELVQGVQDPAVMRLPPGLRDRILFDGATARSNIGGVFVMNSGGGIEAARDPSRHEPLTFADRDYFRVHVARDDVGLFISPPYSSRLRGGSSSIALSRRINASDGSFAGVGVIALKLDYFASLVSDIDVGNAGSAFVIQDDGVVLARKPPAPAGKEKLIGRSPTFHLMTGAPSGSYVSVSRIDGVRRLYTFSRVPGTSLIVVVAPAEDDVLAAWRRRSMVIGGLTLFFGVAFMAVSWLLTIALRARSIAMEKIKRLAGTDPLTGLNNRRALTRHLQDDWRRARRANHPVSALFIDVDYFKRYNDTYGHASGDDALVAVAHHLQRSVHRPGNIVARYGGEEFVVILPGTAAEAAVGFARRVCASIQELAIPNTAAPGHVITVSVGCATAHPVAMNDDPFALLSEADNALYAAKRAGRNRAVHIDDLTAMTSVNQALH
ncbi:diguanylate cyclase [Caballeronia grimmiae]|uniref:diguanylate cyclase n=1 Tax=Caballeronia grimmiae TaxID=1071679 RepID=A0A069NJV8_9BURK|nr:diguanylate cyclase [Caballeronia grimmiae]